MGEPVLSGESAVSTALVPLERFNEVVTKTATDLTKEFRAFKYSPELNCVFIQKGMNVLVLPAFEQADGSIFIDKQLGFDALRKVLGDDRLKLIQETLAA